MIQEVIRYKSILENLPELIEKSPFKKGYIINKVGISAPTFYRKLKSGSFTADETLKILRLINPEEAYLNDLKQTIIKENAAVLKDTTFNRSEIVKEIAVLLDKSNLDKNEGRIIEHSDAMEFLRKKHL